MRRTHPKKELIVSLVRRHFGAILFVLCAFLAGGVFALVFACTMPELTMKELLLYLGDFFGNIQNSGADSGALFQESLLLSAQNFILLFLCSLLVIGAPFVLVFAAVKGFVHSFTLVFMFRLYGMRTLLFFLLGLFPHYLLCAPVYLTACVTALRFSAALGHEKQDLKRKIFRLFFGFLLLFAGAVTASLLQAYIEPGLIRLISGLFIEGT